MQESSHLKGSGANKKVSTVQRSLVVVGFCVAKKRVAFPKKAYSERKMEDRHSDWGGFFGMFSVVVSIISLDAFSVCCMMFLGKAAS